MNPTLKKILVVEDDLSTLEMIRMLLSKNGFEILTEKNGLKIYEIAKETLPDVILLDAMLPGLDGYSIQKKLFNDKETRGIPIIMMTANSQLEQVFSDKENVVEFLPKPFNVNDLREKIDRAIKRNHGKN